MENTPAPEFTLPDQGGANRSLKEFAGKWLVLYFYPEDDTPGCTVEACAFRDDYPKLRERGIEVVGISHDTVESHWRFAFKHRLNFTLLSDVTKEVHELYGAWGKKHTFGVKYEGATRKTFLIDPAGVIVKEYPKVTPEGHVGQILKDFDSLAKR